MFKLQILIVTKQVTLRVRAYLSLRSERSIHHCKMAATIKSLVTVIFP